jgi:hypothetical protein
VKLHAKSTTHDCPFTVASMFTPNLVALADRLKASLDNVAVNYVLYEVPSVHRSISSHGGDELVYCKPSFIERVLDFYGKPILYVDADIIFRETPVEIAKIAKEHSADFAIYNWLADDANAAYVDAGVQFGEPKRFYFFSHSIDGYDASQLLSSGAVIFHTDASRPLLHEWRDTIISYPDAMDDQSLDYTFNFTVGEKRPRAYWLGKNYCRYGFWPHIKPVIDHPDLPTKNGLEKEFARWAGRERVDSSRVLVRPTRTPFPRELLFDSKAGLLLRPTTTGAEIVGRSELKLWI